MDKNKLLKTVERTGKTVSFVLILKGAVAGSVAVLALAGVTVPYLTTALGLTYHHVATQGIAGVFGAAVGVVAAIKA